MLADIAISRVVVFLKSTIVMFKNSTLVLVVLLALLFELLTCLLKVLKLVTAGVRVSSCLDSLVVLLLGFVK